MVLKVIGRKTGKIYCYQGKRLEGQWCLNLKTNPKVEIFRPDGHLLGFAEDATDSQERVGAMRQILKSSGLGGFVYGFNPSTASDKLVQEKISNIPVVRITSSIPRIDE